MERTPTPRVLSRRQALGMMIGAVAASSVSQADELPQQLFADAEAFPYTFSSLEMYARMESELLPDHGRATRVIALADGIAERVHELFSREIISQHPFQSEGVSPTCTLRLAARRVELQQRYMVLLAQALREEGYQCAEGASYDYAMRLKEFVHLLPIDCDLTSHLGLHVARSHSQPIAGAAGKQHMYLCSTVPYPQAGAYEMTAIRLEDRYLSSHTEQRSKDKLEDAAADILGLYRPMSEQELKQMVAGNVLWEMCRVMDIQPWSARSADRVCDVGEHLLSAYGPGYYILQNLIEAHHASWKRRNDTAGTPEFAVGQDHWMRAEYLRTRFATLLGAMDRQKMS